MAVITEIAPDVYRISVFAQAALSPENRPTVISAKPANGVGPEQQ